MCLTIANATDVRDHQDNPPPARGYTRTRHYASYLEPGDLWRPEDDRPDRSPDRDRSDRPLRTVMAVRNEGRDVVLTDQFGVVYHYPKDAVVPTAVADPWSFPRIKRWS